MLAAGALPKLSFSNSIFTFLRRYTPAQLNIMRDVFVNNLIIQSVGLKLSAFFLPCFPGRFVFRIKRRTDQPGRGISGRRYQTSKHGRTWGTSAAQTRHDVPSQHGSSATCHETASGNYYSLLYVHVETFFKNTQIPIDFL